MVSPPEIWTIGHSNRNIETFISILRSFDIEVVADVRQFPGSRKYPHFNKENLSESLQQHNIGYVHMVELGGRRKPAKDSPNITWKNDAFRAYADYMETEDFRNAVSKLEELASAKRTAYMCSEAVWWSCHRSMISDHLKANGWKVMHIMDINKAKEHPYTAPARIIEGRLTYRPDDAQFLFSI
jgi:uncharacterized protein (DUF488 family)